MSQSLRNAAERGAEYLDEHEAGWAEKIDRDSLNMRTACDCVLGQRHNTYWDGLSFWGIEEDDAHTLGFTLPEDSFQISWQDRQGQWEQLNRHWLDLINERLALSSGRCVP